MSTIPDSVILLNSKFNNGIFNASKTKRQIDGYFVDDNENYILPKSLCHDESYLLYLCRGENNPSECVQNILDNSYEIKVSEYRAMTKDINSEWHLPAPELK
tara:strand:+ start:47 stop:352 length:306 start_codon:yes stop_codon:yes gene_type:complete